MLRFFAFILLVVVGAAAVSGCGEREQIASYKDGKYRGKPDNRPWDSASPGGSADWAKGDRESWQRQIRARGEAQNENRRIGH